jgi:PPOX class probable F420-dependent enzyme
MATEQSGGAVIPGKYADILEKVAFANIATIGPHGEPQNNPVWFEWGGERLKFSQTKGRQKYKNLQREPRLAVSIIDPDNPYRYLELRGRVVEVEEDLDNAFIDKMAKKYLDADEYPYHQPGDERIVVYVEPEHATHMG